MKQVLETVTSGAETDLYFWRADNHHAHQKRKTTSRPGMRTAQRTRTSDLAGTNWHAYLVRNERLLWYGRPAAGIRFRKRDLFMIPFGLLWTGIVIAWEANAYSHGEPWLVLLFGGAFLLIGVYLAVGRLFWDAIVRRFTRYALTDKRAFIAKDIFGKSLRIFPIGRWTYIEYRPGRESTIIFATESKVTDDGSETTEFGFEFIDDGPKVESLMRKLQTGEFNSQGGHQGTAITSKQ